MTESDLLAMPMWRDPRQRKVIFNGDDIDVGLLFIDADGLAYLTESGIVMEYERSEFEVEFLRSLPMMGGRFTLHTPDGSYRCYFNRPVESAPRLNPSVIDHIVGYASDGSQILSMLGGPLGSFGGLVSAVSDLGTAFEFMAEARRGARYAESVRALLAVPTTRVPVTAYYEDDDSSPTAVGFSPDGRLLASAHSDLTVRVWDLVTDSELWRFDLGDVGEDVELEVIEFDPTNRHLAVAWNAITAGKVYVWPAGGGTPKTICHDEGVWFLAWVDGRHLVVLCYVDGVSLRAFGRG